MTLNNGTATSHGPTAGAARMPGCAGTLAAACGAVFVAQVANALPASLNGLFQQDLNTHGSQLTWVTAAFMIAVVCFEFTFGVLGDLFGRRRLVLAGTALVAVGSTVAALAPTVQVLWLGAALNGLGAGAMFPGSLTAVTAVTRDVRQRGHPRRTAAGTRRRRLERVPVRRRRRVPPARWHVRQDRDMARLLLGARRTRLDQHGAHRGGGDGVESTRGP